jgi:hypothetical protein
MANSLIIGLGSKAQIGKDYAAAQLKKYFDIERIAFADELKNDLKYLFERNGFDFDMLMAEPALKTKARPLLVSYGQVMREFNPDIWINRALKNKELQHQVTIITDVRFPNEVNVLKSLGGQYVEIISDVPPANETEAYYSPLMEGLADFKIKNNFDGQFIKDMVELVNNLLQNSKI